MLTIYGFDPSAWANAVRFTANALGLDYEYRRVNLLAGEGQHPEYLAIHPAGKVPAMDDDGFRLFESGAIQRYLARKAGSELYPSEPRAQALVDQWSLYTTTHVANAVSKVIFHRRLHALVGAPSSPEQLAEGESFLERFLPVIDAELGRSRHLAGDDLSIADLMLLAWVDPAELGEIDLTPYGNLGAWRARLKAEPYYTRCHRDYASTFDGLASRAGDVEIDGRSATA